VGETSCVGAIRDDNDRERSPIVVPAEFKSPRQKKEIFRLVGRGAFRYRGQMASGTNDKKRKVTLGAEKRGPIVRSSLLKKEL